MKLIETAGHPVAGTAAAKQHAQKHGETSPSAGAEEHAGIRGYLEGADGGVVVGWAADISDYARKLQIEILEGDRVVAVREASVERLDLRDAGIGDGRHAFRVMMPRELCDGQKHSISARVQGTETPLPGSPVDFTHVSRFEGKIEGLEGTAIKGRVCDVEGEKLDIEVLENGKVIASTTLIMDKKDAGTGCFKIELPAEAFDGGIHLFTVRTAEPYAILGELPAITPCVMTPEDALQKWASDFKGYLSHSSALRYESLRNMLGNLARNNDARSVLDTVRQLAQAHEQVIHGFMQPPRQFAPLAFPEIDDPMVSIVIPVHNKFPVTYNCLASLLVAPNEATFEVIIVDDGSTDETLQLAELVKGVATVRHEEARGFVRSCNHGGSLARGKYIVMLNNDTEVTSNWLDAMIRVFDDFDGVGMSGAKLIYPNGTLQEAGGIVWGNGNPWNYGRNGNPHDPRYNYVRQVDYISGACIMLPTELWNELGGFDEHFAPAYYEDTDLAFRVRDRGLKTIYTPFAEVVHFEGISSGTSTASGMKKYQAINQPKFKQRWVDAYRHNGELGKKVELAKDRNVQYRALVIDGMAPRPDKDAGGYAAIQEMRLLQAHGFKLTFVPENLAYLGNYTEDLQRMGVECIYSPFCTSIADVLEERGAEFDVIYITRYHVAAKLMDAIRRLAPKAKVIFNNADLHFLRELRVAIASKNHEDMTRALKVRDEELAVMRKVDLVLSYNEVEHAVIMSHNLDSTQVAKCPWVVETQEQVPPYEARMDIAFLGGYGHSPNVEAVEYFAREIMPDLRKALPGVRFLIYGSHVPDSFKQLEDEDIVIKGYVQDVAEVYGTCRIFIAPLLTGAGLKGKVIGALSHGLPTVLSPVAAEATGIRHGLDAMIATTPGEWVDAIAGLYRDKAAWEKMSQAAKAYTRHEYSFEHGLKLMGEALSMVDLFPGQKNQVLVYKGK